MNPNIKHYFRDEGTEDSGRDEFGALDIARELKKKIDELGAPLTISLEGPHGTGKSFVAALLEEQFGTDPNYEFIKIEAWRHAGESRRKAFLFDVLEQLKSARYERGEKSACRKLDELQNELYASKAQETAVFEYAGAQQSLDNFKKIWRAPILRRGLGTFLAVFVAYIVLFFLLSFLPSIPWLNALKGALPLAVTALIIVLGFLGDLMKPLLEPAKITLTNSAPESSEQIERIFRRTLEHIGKDTKNHTTDKKERRLVIVVDELDRLNAGEIIEALNVIRTFRDVRPCIVVVALDESVIVSALQRKPDESVGLIGNKDEAEEYLNKFFKLRQRLVKQAPRDMRNFARTLTNNGSITAGIATLNGIASENVFDALLHREVVTPRHVKRLLNGFNSAWSLAQRRETAAEEKRLLSPGALTGHLPFLALITALQEDFPDFYEDLGENPELIANIDLVLDGKSIPLFARESCLRYFEPKDAETEDVSATEKEPDYRKPKPKHRALIRHLQATRKFHHSNAVPFLFFREGIPARVLGNNVLAEEIIADLESNLVAPLQEKLRVGGAELCEATAQIVLWCLQESNASKRENVLLASVSLFEPAILHQLSPALRQQLSNTIAQNLDEHFDGFINEISISELLNLLSVDPTYHHHRCVAAMVNRLRTELDRSREESSDASILGQQIVKGLVEFPELLSQDAHRDTVAEFTEFIADASLASDLQSWFELIEAHAENKLIAGKFFDVRFLLAAAETLAGAEADIFTDEYKSAFKGAFAAIQAHSARQDQDALLEIGNVLQRVKCWDVNDFGFSLLDQNRNSLTLAQASKALGVVYNSANCEMETRSDGVAICAAMYDWTLALLERLDASQLVEDEAYVEMDKYFARVVLSEKSDIQRDARHAFVSIILQADKPLNDTIEILRTFITENVDNPAVQEVCAILLQIANVLEEADLDADLNTITTALLAGQTDQPALVGANVLLQALSENMPVAAREGALKYLQPLVEMLVPTSYPPANLIHVARVLDKGIVQEGASQPAVLSLYLANVNAYLIRPTGEANNFALLRLKVMDEHNLVSAELQIGLTRNIVSVWSRIESDVQPIAVQLLSNWTEQMAEETALSYRARLAELAETRPLLAWQGTGIFWQQMTSDERIAIISAVKKAHYPTPQNAPKPENSQEAWQIMLADIGQEANMLDVEEVYEILASELLQVGSGVLCPLVEALTLHFLDDDKDFLAGRIYDFVAAQPEPSEPAFDAVRLIQRTARAEAMPIWIAALGGDKFQQDLVLFYLPDFISKPGLSTEHQNQLIVALAPIVEASDGKKLHDVVDLVDKSGWLKPQNLQVVQVFETALKSALLRRKGKRSNADKIDRRVIIDALKKLKSVPKPRGNSSSNE